MVIYVDVLLFENFIINLFLLITTMRILRLNYKKSVYFSAFLGAIYTLMIFLEISFITSFLGKILVASLMIFIIMESKNIKDLVKAVGTFFLISFTVCGLIFSFVLMKNEYNVGGGFQISNYSIKYSIIALMALYIVIIRLVSYFRDQAVINELLYDIEISYNKEKYYLRGFLDTGNELREPVTNLPCIIVEGMCLQEFNITEDEFFYIRYKTIGDEGRLKGFRGEKIRIRNDNEEWKTVDAIICSCKNKLSKHNKYNALLSRGVI